MSEIKEIRERWFALLADTYEKEVEAVRERHNHAQEDIETLITAYDQLRTERDRYREQLGKLAFVYGLCSGCQICDCESVGDDICDKCVSMTFEEKENYWEELKRALEVE